MKIWLVTGGEPLPIEGGAEERLLRAGLMAKYFTASGHDVTWWRPDFDHRTKRHFHTNVNIIGFASNGRVKLLASPGYDRNISIQRLLDHIAVGRQFRRRTVEEPMPDIIVASLPTLELAAEAIRYGKAHKIPVVLDLRDMWPEVYIWHMPHPIQGIARNALSRVFKWRDRSLAQASAIWGISEDFLNFGLKCAGRERRNGDGSFYLLDHSVAPAKREIDDACQFWNEILGPSGKGEILGCFAGSVNNQFDLATVASAAVETRRLGAGFRIVIAGDGETRKDLVRKFGQQSGVVCPGWVNRARLQTLLTRSQFGIDPMPPRPDFEATINNKAVDYLKAGRGIVSCPSNGALARLLQERGCGRSYPCGDVAYLVRIFASLASDHEIVKKWSEAARIFADTELDYERIYGGMAASLSNLVEEDKTKKRYEASSFPS